MNVMALMKAAARGDWVFRLVPRTEDRQNSRAKAERDRAMVLDKILERWRGHSAMTDPYGHAERMRVLPSDISTLCRIVGHLLIHSDWLTEYGLADCDFESVSRETLPASVRLSNIARADPRSLLLAREPRARSVGTCRDYAVMLCSILRNQGSIARVRCGFASYFVPGRWEDHWVCERWIPDERRWARADAQMDAVLRHHLRMTFDPTDLPPAAFLTAGEAWLKCRSGQSDPESFGHGIVGGWWFMHVNVVRDHLALNHREVSAWDTWREADGSRRVLADHALEWIDDLARHPDRILTDVPPPPWK